MHLKLKEHQTIISINDKRSTTKFNTYFKNLLYILLHNENTLGIFQVRSKANMPSTTTTIYSCAGVMSHGHLKNENN